AADRLPDPLHQTRGSRKVYDGRLRVSTILSEWQLDADLVVLSACDTGLGKNAGGEGLLGVAQAFLHKRARGGVVSSWRVEDIATALVRRRFYENLWGKREGMKKPLPRAEALAEAKKWLRELTRGEALALAGGLVAGEVRGTVKKLAPPEKKPET